MNGFAFPAYLSGFLLLLIPIILHLMKRKPVVPQPYPSFFFLKKTIVRKQRRNNLRKFLILLFRCLAFLCIACAFAYPFVSDIALTPKDATILVLDSSFSTGASRAQMRSALKSALSDISPEHPMLIASAAGRIHWSGDFSADRNALETWALNRMDSCQTSSFATIFAMADSRFQNIQAERKHLVVITDRQALPWEGAAHPGKLRNVSDIRIAGAEAGKKTPNIAVVRAELAGNYTHAGQDLLLNTEIHNFNTAPEPVSLTVELDKHIVLTKETVIPAHGSFREQFRLKNHVPIFRPIPGKIRITAKNNAISLDDTRYFAANPVTPPTVFLTPLPGQNPREFIRTALTSRGDTLDSLAPDLHPLTPATARNAIESDILIVENPNAVKNMESILDQQLASGGTAVILWRNSERTRLLLNHFGFHIRKAGLRETHRLELIDFEHTLFKDYLNINAGSWFDILFFNVPQIVPPQNARIIAAFSDRLPALMEVPRGKGKLFVLAVPPDRDHTNWQTFANFLPFWRELILQANRKSTIQTEFTADGSPHPLPGEVASPETEIISDGRTFRLNTPGCYLCGKLLYTINPPAKESDTTPLPENFDPSTLLNPQAAQILNQNTAGKTGILKAAAGKHSPWRLILLTALLCFLAELGLANRTVL